MRAEFGTLEEWAKWFAENPMGFDTLGDGKLATVLAYYEYLYITDPKFRDATNEAILAFGKEYGPEIALSVIGGPVAGRLGQAISRGMKLRNIAKLRELSQIMKAAKQIDRNGMTKAGRALQKHGSRPDSVYKYTSQKAADLNKEGAKIVRDILRNPKAVTKINPRTGVKEVYIPKGKGVTINKDGSFKGFTNPDLRGY